MLALRFLITEQFIIIQEINDERRLVATPLGFACCLSGIPPKDSLIVLKSLQQARECLILKGGLHPVFLVTSPSTNIQPDWDQYERILHDLYQEHPVNLNNFFNNLSNVT